MLLGNGDGTFQPTFDIGQAFGLASVAVADLNGDGKVDLVVTNSYFADVAVLLGNGDRSFRPSLFFGTGDGPYRVIVADMNGDGKWDLVTANWTTNNISLLINTTSQQESGDRLAHPQLSHNGFCQRKTQ